MLSVAAKSASEGKKKRGRRRGAAAKILVKP